MSLAASQISFFYENGYLRLEDVAGQGRLAAGH